MYKINHFVVPVVLALLSGFAAGAQAELTIANSAKEVMPVGVGDKAPAFTVYQVDGSEYHFDPDNVATPTVLLTFRGGWCPFCNTQLRDLREVIPELTAAGYDVLFLSADRPEILYSSLKEENQDVDYTILSDSKMQASSALGIAFRNPDAAIERMKGFGIDLEKASGETHHALPVPSVFVIDTGGVIRFAHVDPNFRVRLSVDDVRAAAALVAP